MLSDFGQKFVNTFIVAIGVVVGKITLVCITAFALVFFEVRGRIVSFWAIFIALMPPLEVRIVPTYAVAANALSPFQTIMDWTGVSHRQVRHPWPRSPSATSPRPTARPRS